MVPPSLAFAGVVLNNRTLVEAAHEQCLLYREGMRNESAGLWAHILLGEGIEDTNRWLTGNAWAAYGMMRVLATIVRSPWAGDMQQEVRDLQGWVTEILGTSQNHMVRRVCCRSYIPLQSTRSQVVLSKDETDRSRPTMIYCETTLTTSLRSRMRPVQHSWPLLPCTSHLPACSSVTSAVRHADHVAVGECRP